MEAIRKLCKKQRIIVASPDAILSDVRNVTNITISLLVS
jgi:hypothetical protein